MESGKNASKTRNWAFVLYEGESAPKNWREMLEETRIPIFISPLHDQDVDSKSGEVKKPHYHILLMLDGPVTKKRADALIEPFNGTKSAEYVKSLKGFVRYLAHLDNPEKAQYSSDDIIALNGADLAEALKPSTADIYKIIGEIMLFCEENSVHELSKLAKYAIYSRADWFNVIIEKAYLFTQFLHSLRHSQSRDK